MSVCLSVRIMEAFGLYFCGLYWWHQGVNVKSLEILAGCLVFVCGSWYANKTYALKVFKTKTRG
jgi:hypothetical protein